MTYKPYPGECYDLYKQLKHGNEATTKDGWVIRYDGDRNNAASQLIIATKEGQEIILKHYYGGEGIARVLLKARNDQNHTSS